MRATDSTLLASRPFGSAAAIIGFCWTRLTGCMMPVASAAAAVVSVASDRS